MTDARTVTLGGVAAGVPPSNGHTAPPDAAPGSVLERVRSVANAKRAPLALDLPLDNPPWDGRLVIRYGTLPIDDAERFAAMNDKLGELAQSLNLMVDACRTVLWAEDGVTTDLGVRLDAGLWTFMDWPLPPTKTIEHIAPRDVITVLFGDNSVALGGHLNKLGKWMDNPSLDAESLGESPAASS